LGTQFLHKRKILHRDIKFDSIFIKNEKIFKLSNFGVATTEENPTVISLGMLKFSNIFFKSIIGTISFMAPERIGHLLP
jgi:serine/threonine protein kinase